MAIRVGLVGYGLAGKVFHAPLIASEPALELAGIVTSRADQARQDYPQAQVYASLDDLLAADIHLVVIATPNTTHFPFAAQALRAGKHVVVDKPFTTTAHEAADLIAMAQEQSVVLSVFQNRRWDNDFLTVRRVLDAGMLGAIHTYEAHYDRYRPDVHGRWREQDLPGSGVLFDLGAHLIDQALMLFGMPDSVWADIRRQRPGAAVDDYFQLVLRYSDRSAILRAGSLVLASASHFRIDGDHGSLRKNGIDPQEDALRAGQRPGDPGWGEDRPEQYAELTYVAGDLTMQGVARTLPGSYEAYYRGIADAIANGASVPVAPEDALNTMRVIAAAFQSQVEQRAISL
jgi:scyllo-inositol 2-dehydrogenase (NADP+)